MSILAVDVARKELNEIIGSDFSQSADRAEFLKSVVDEQTGFTDKAVQIALPEIKENLVTRVKDFIKMPLDRLVETAHRIEIIETKRPGYYPGYVTSGTGDFQVIAENSSNWRFVADISHDGKLQSASISRRSSGNITCNIDLNFEGGLRANQAISRLLERANESGRVVEI